MTRRRRQHDGGDWFKGVQVVSASEMSTRGYDLPLETLPVALPTLPQGVVSPETLLEHSLPTLSERNKSTETTSLPDHVSEVVTDVIQESPEQCPPELVEPTPFSHSNEAENREALADMPVVEEVASSVPPPIALHYDLASLTAQDVASLEPGTCASILQGMIPVLGVVAQDTRNGVIICQAPSGIAHDGFLEGDRLCSIEGKVISTRKDIGRAIAQYSPGTVISVDVTRGGTKPVTVAWIVQGAGVAPEIVSALQDRVAQGCTR
jgi:hypothetical protein